ncbi:hypothetical protein Ddc_18506 [Ditylenchus destructor]|nr:hypothetical protein Ddc_18506 [Ditylenchus destructor]
MKDVFFYDDDFKCLCSNRMGITLLTFDKFKESLSLERFDDPTFLRIVGALLATPKFRQEYNVPHKHAYKFVSWLWLLHNNPDDFFDDANMSYLPNEIYSDITNFLPNDDITDLMFVSLKFNALVTSRLRKINEEMATVNRSIESFMPKPTPDHADNEWISLLNFKKFEPIGTEAKNLMKEMFDNEKDVMNCLRKTENLYMRSEKLQKLKEGMSLERFDNSTFVRILGALVSIPKFRQEYNISRKLAHWINRIIAFLFHHNTYLDTIFDDVRRIWSFYNPGCSLYDVCDG